MAKLVNKFAVGCDPEFAVIDKAGRLVRVRSLGAGAVGYDHDGRCVELRPEQARGTYTILKRLQALMLTPKLKAFKDHKWRAGAYFNDGHDTPISLGGHIHFDIPSNKLDRTTLPALDAVTRLLEHTEILPNAECVTRRTQTQYGKWGQIRTDDGHTEYRTMASWMFNPWVAFLALTMSKLAVVTPALALEKLQRATSREDIEKFVGLFSGKDINADRLLWKLEDKKDWLDTSTDTDIKTAWEGRL